MTKFTKKEVDYQRGHKDSHCGKSFKDDLGYCRHFIEQAAHFGHCEVVEGNINKVYWCTKFERAKK